MDLEADVVGPTIEAIAIDSRSHILPMFVFPSMIQHQGLRFALHKIPCGLFQNAYHEDMAQISSLHAMAECRPPRPAWWHYPLMALYAAMPGVFVFIAVFITMELLNGFTTSADVKLWLLAGCYVAGLALMALFLYWEQQRWYWVLTSDALVGGTRHNRVFPISSITRIVPGRPVTKMVKYAFGRGVTQHTRDTLKVAYGMSLVIEFSDGSLMPFHVHACAGGTHLMNQLIETHQSLFDKNYKFSERQKKALVIADWNKRTKPLRRF